MVTALFRTVVEHNVETSRQRDYQFLLSVERVAETLLAEFPVEEVTVRLKKPRAPVAADFDYMAVEITRRAEVHS